ncbi:MAG: hypothetical protein FWD86_03230 [Firmicutes bacterium]|nr:hypothetical protein [Bacillota bacterium]
MSEKESNHSIEIMEKNFDEKAIAKKANLLLLFGILSLVLAILPTTALLFTPIINDLNWRQITVVSAYIIIIFAAFLGTLSLVLNLFFFLGFKTKKALVSTIFSTAPIVVFFVSLALFLAAII